MAVGRANQFLRHLAQIAEGCTTLGHGLRFVEPYFLCKLSQFEVGALRSRSMLSITKLVSFSCTPSEKRLCCRWVGSVSNWILFTQCSGYANLSLRATVRVGRTWRVLEMRCSWYIRRIWRPWKQRCVYWARLLKRLRRKRKPTGRTSF